MKPNMKSVGLTLVIAGIFLTLLIGGQYFFKNNYQAERFQTELKKIDGVKNVQIADEKIIVTIENTTNLKESYEEIREAVGNKDYQIIIQDGASGKLKEIAAECEIAIQEAIARGNFTVMESYIKELAREQDSEAKIYVDSERVYLQLKSGNYAFYRIIARPQITDLPTIDS